jgi:Fe2+ or Zn2+ uptake regulation protein
MQYAAHDITSAAELDRRLSGNESKILRAIFHLEREATPPTADTIAAWAHLDRATVYRALKRLTADAYVQYTLTERGKAAVKCALDPMIQGYIMDIDGPRNERLPEPPPDPSHFAIPQRGLTSQNATTVAPRDTATLNGKAALTSRVNSSGNVNLPPSEYATFRQRQAKDRAALTCQMLQDPTYLGMHRLAWYTAITVDEAKGNRDQEAWLMALAVQLRDAHRATGRHQGKAFTAKAKAHFEAIGAPMKAART